MLYQYSHSVFTVIFDIFITLYGKFGYNAFILHCMVSVDLQFVEIFIDVVFF